MNKISDTLQAAVADIRDGSTVLIGGFGGAGMPTELIHALIEQGARDLTVVNNNAGNGETGLAALLKAGRVRKIVCSFPRSSDPHVFEDLYRNGRIELECVPQGTLAERLRAAGSGIGGFYTPAGYGNLVYRKAARNFGPVMCMAAKTAIVQVREIVDLGALDPEAIVTPGIFVQRVVQVTNPQPSS